jgi:hypothetical protein
MKFVDTRPYADPEAAARKLLEIANSVEPVQDGRIHIEKMNWPLSFATLAVTTRRGHEMATQAISFEYAQSHCNRDEFCHRLNSNLLHHPTAVRLYSAVCNSKLPRDLFDEFAPRHQFEHLPLPRRQSTETPT